MCIRDSPKPLVTVNGVRILETLLDALVAVGIRDITVVRGYRKECFDALLEKYPFLTLVDNDIYSKTNNISSVDVYKRQDVFGRRAWLFHNRRGWEKMLQSGGHCGKHWKRTAAD